MNSSKNKILLDSLIDQRKGFQLAKTVIISFSIAAVLIVAVALFIGYESIQDSRRIESVIDMDGYRWQIITTHKENTLPIKYRATARMVMYFAYCHNEYSYKVHMDKLQHLLDKKSFDLIEAEYIREKRLNNLMAYNMSYVIDPYKITNEDISLDLKNMQGSIKAIQERVAGDNKIYVQIEASFSIYNYDQGLSDDNPHGVKLYNWKWIEQQVNIQE